MVAGSVRQRYDTVHIFQAHTEIYNNVLWRFRVPADNCGSVVPWDVSTILQSKCSKQVFNALAARNDDQIMALELYAILAGILSFRDQIRNSNVIIFTDNVGGECALKKQTAKAMDHNMLVHHIWANAAALKSGIWIERVPSAQNIADGPTRPGEEVAMSILNKLQATECMCRLPCEFVWSSDVSLYAYLRPSLTITIQHLHIYIRNMIMLYVVRMLMHECMLHNNICI